MKTARRVLAFFRRIIQKDRRQLTISSLALDLWAAREDVFGENDAACDVLNRNGYCSSLALRLDFSCR
jgi:hypothetical protein